MTGYNISCGIALGVAAEFITKLIVPSIDFSDRITIIIAVGYGIFIGLTTICHAIKCKK